MKKVSVTFQDWGIIPYQQAWDMQTKLHNELKERKIRNRREDKAEKQSHYLIFCEHHPVYTLGKSGSMDHLLLSETELRERNIDFFKINRGGDITYHGPGQIVAYPIFDLDEFFTDVHKYVRLLEQSVINTLRRYEIHGESIKDYTGVWLPSDEYRPERKICAIGVHLSRWVTMHGLAFNVNTDLEYFDNIIPCGIDEADKEVTSMEKELGRKVEYAEVQKILHAEFKALYDFEFE